MAKPDKKKDSKSPKTAEVPATAPSPAADAAAPEQPAAEAGAPAPVVDTAAADVPKAKPAGGLKHASIAVSARAAGRWRAGRFFTREETVIPCAELTEAQIAAIEGDPQLIVSLRVPKPD